jgi:hypothetical protein
MDCPRCKSSQYNRAGYVKGRQRYRCKSCNRHYSVAHRGDYIEPHIKATAIKMSLEGMGYRAIGRVLGVSNVSVLNWVREKALKAKPLDEPRGQVAKVQIDELHTYVGNKKKTWSGYGRRSMSGEGSGWTSNLVTAARPAEQLFGEE